jgi:glycogen operon protein
MVRFVHKLISLRHEYPTLRRGRFLTGQMNEELGVRDATWVNPTGADMSMDDWHDANAKCFGMLMDGRAQATGIRRRGSAATLLFVLNANAGKVAFTLPDCADGKHWKLLFDTTTPDDHADHVFNIADVYAVTGRSCVLFRLNA